MGYEVSEFAYYQTHDDDIERVRQTVQDWTDNDLERMHRVFMRQYEPESAACCLAELKRRNGGIWVEHVLSDATAGEE